MHHAIKKPFECHEIIAFYGKGKIIFHCHLSGFKGETRSFGGVNFSDYSTVLYCCENIEKAEYISWCWSKDHKAWIDALESRCNPGLGLIATEHLAFLGFRVFKPKSTKVKTQDPIMWRQMDSLLISSHNCQLILDQPSCHKVLVLEWAHENSMWRGWLIG